MNILVVNLLRLGDIVISTPLFKALKAHFPKAEISVLVRKPGADICKCVPEIDRIFVYQNKFSLLRYIKDFKNQDCVIYLMENKHLRLKFFSVLNIPRRVGYLLPNVKQKYLTDVVDWQGEFEGLEKLFLKVLEPLEIRNFVNTQPELTPRAEDLEKYEQILPQNDFKIAIHIGSYAPSRRWPYFDRLIQLILAKTTAYIILTGTEQDKILGPDLAQISPQRILDLRGKTGLRELPALFKMVDLVIGNDTGAVHIARAVNTKTIIIFGPEDPRIIGDNSNTIKIYPDELACKNANTFFDIPFPNVRRCRKWDCKQGDCLKKISVERVWKQVKQVLEKE
ncbi:MAG: glycosyltransferase family 9 protein [Candidatus Desulfofervidaceae bacterium]|nr:glycosyltransferase family 9 protein [Candidatus Desulfofervidaceae bacterium]